MIESNSHRFRELDPQRQLTDTHHKLVITRTSVTDTHHNTSLNTMLSTTNDLGVIEELDEPSEFHFDSETKILTLWHNETSGTPPPTDGNMCI